MKVSLNWAQYYSNVDLAAIGKDKLLEKIGAQLGAIDEVEEWGVRFEGIVVVKVLDCQPHGNADKLTVCTVDDGGKVASVERDGQGHVQVVCGAPNVHAGMLAAWIPPGVTVPNTLGKEPLVLEARDIRGHTSHGMLASPAELGMSEDHNGILEIKEGEVKDGTKPGDSLVSALWLDNEIVIDIENKMFTHRPDLFGILGVARELAGIQQLSFKSPDWYLNLPQFESKNDLPLEVKVDDHKLVPRFMAVAMKNVRVGPSSASLQSDLARVGLKPINNIVDITNYVMHLTAQPMHAYDADKLKNLGGLQNLSLETRLSRKGEKISLLGGKELELQDNSTILITSGNKPVGIGGVIGGSDTEVDASTKNIVLECANFDMFNIRRTAMQYGLFTDAVTRFTKGQSQLQNDRAIAYAIKLINEHAGGQQASDVKDAHGELPSAKTVSVSAAFINDRLGEKLSSEGMAKLLRNVEFDVQVSGEELSVTAPFWRTDVEIPEDIVEEVGRLYGYDHLPLELPKRSIKPSPVDSLLSTKNQLREALSAAGANEVLTYTFAHGELLDKVGQNKDQAYQLANALSPDLQYYRLSLMPSLLEKVHPNIKQGFSEFALFEINPVHAKGFVDAEGLPVEDQRLALVFAADEKTAKQKYGGAPYYQAKKYLTNLLAGLGITELIYEQAGNYEPKQAISQAAIAPFEKQRAAIVKTKDGQFIAELGEFRTAVRKNLKLPQFIAGFELDVNELVKLIGKSKIYKPISRFPKVEQDISLKVPAHLSYGELYEYLQEELNQIKPKNSSISLKPIDIFKRDDGDTHKQVALRFTIASYERTLTAEEINSLLDKAAQAAKTKFGAERL